MTLEVATAALASAIRTNRVELAGTEVLRRYEVEISPLDPLGWVSAQPRGERVYFRNREGSLAIGGVGRCFAKPNLADHSVAACLSSESNEFPETGQPGEPFFFVVNWFDPSTAARSPQAWGGFAPSRVVLPRIELRRTRECLLAVHVCDDDALALAALDRLGGACAESLLPHGFRLSEDGDPARWADSIDAALAEIQRGAFEKVVLARTREYQADEPIDPCAILAALRLEEPATFHVLVEQSPSRAFVAASPERLFRRKGRLIHSEAVAGTCTRGRDADADERLSTRLLASEKNRREHECVVRRVEAALTPWTRQLARDSEPRVMRLRHVQHLMTGIVGHLREEAHDEVMLDELHPTPAVCGWPLAESRSFIRDREEVARGLYAGVVGVVSASRSDFTVAIRSAVIREQSLLAFAGAGIVRGSEADAEWLETSRKLESFEGIARRASQSSWSPRGHGGCEPARAHPVAVNP